MSACKFNKSHNAPTDGATGWNKQKNYMKGRQDMNKFTKDDKKINQAPEQIGNSGKIQIDESGITKDIINDGIEPESKNIIRDSEDKPDFDSFPG